MLFKQIGVHMLAGVCLLAGVFMNVYMPAGVSMCMYMQAGVCMCM